MGGRQATKAARGTAAGRARTAGAVAAVALATTTLGKVAVGKMAGTPRLSGQRAGFPPILPASLPSIVPAILTSILLACVLTGWLPATPAGAQTSGGQTLGGKTSGGQKPAAYATAVPAPGAQRGAQIFPYQWDGEPVPLEAITLADIQFALIWTGHYTGFVDSVDGRATQDAARRWLQAHGATGLPGGPAGLAPEQMVALVGEGLAARDRAGWQMEVNEYFGTGIGASSVFTAQAWDDAKVPPRPWSAPLRVEADNFLYLTHVKPGNGDCARMRAADEDEWKAHAGPDFSMQRGPDWTLVVHRNAEVDLPPGVSGPKRRTVSRRSQCRQDAVASITIDETLSGEPESRPIFLAIRETLSLANAMNKNARDEDRILPLPPAPYRTRPAAGTGTAVAQLKAPPPASPVASPGAAPHGAATHGSTDGATTHGATGTTAGGQKDSAKGGQNGGTQGGLAAILPAAPTPAPATTPLPASSPSTPSPTQLAQAGPPVASPIAPPAAPPVAPAAKPAAPSSTAPPGVAPPRPTIPGTAIPAPGAQRGARVFPYRWDRPVPAEAIAPADIQFALAWTGHYDGIVDGIAGPATEAAVRRWLRAQGQPEAPRLAPAQQVALVVQGLALRDRAGFRMLVEPRQGWAIGVATALFTRLPEAEWDTQDDRLYWKLSRDEGPKAAGYTLALVPVAGDGCTELRRSETVREPLEPGETSRRERVADGSVSATEFAARAGGPSPRMSVTRRWQCRDGGIAVFSLSTPPGEVSARHPVLIAMRDSLSLAPAGVVAADLPPAPRLEPLPLAPSATTGAAIDKAATGPGMETGPATGTGPATDVGTGTGTTIPPVPAPGIAASTTGAKRESLGESVSEAAAARRSTLPSPATGATTTGPAGNPTTIVAPPPSAPPPSATLAAPQAAPRATTPAAGTAVATAPGTAATGPAPTGAASVPAPVPAWALGDPASAGRVFPYRWTRPVPAARIATADLQLALVWTGHFDGLVDGAEGPALWQALRAWRTARGRPADAPLGPEESVALVGEGLAARDAAGWALLVDEASGIASGFPATLAELKGATANGSSWSIESRGLLSPTYMTFAVEGGAGCTRLRELAAHALTKGIAPPRQSVRAADAAFMAVEVLPGQVAWQRFRCRPAGIAVLVALRHASLPADRGDPVATALANSLILAPTFSPAKKPAPRLVPLPLAPE